MTIRILQAHKLLPDRVGESVEYNVPSARDFPDASIELATIWSCCPTPAMADIRDMFCGGVDIGELNSYDWKRLSLRGDRR